MKKEIVARICYYTGISWLFFFLGRLVYGDHIRAINYHGTPRSLSGRFSEQMEWYRRWYSNVDLEGLRSFLKGERSFRKKPGLIISFDDGKRNNFDVAIPILEKYGFTGWFFLPVGWIKGSVSEQREWQKEDLALLAEYPGDRVIVSAEEVVRVMGKHVVGCHTFSHHRMQEMDSDAELDHEIRFAQQELETLTGARDRIFCWVGGELAHYTRKAAERIAEAEFEFSFTTNTYPIKRDSDPLRLERSNIECDYSKELVLFQLSGLMDILYARKRTRLKPVFQQISKKG